jgi:hypothetical protein
MPFGTKKVCPHTKTARDIFSLAKTRYPFCRPTPCTPHMLVTLGVAQAMSISLGASTTQCNKALQYRPRHVLLDNSRVALQRERAPAAENGVCTIGDQTLEIGATHLPVARLAGLRVTGWAKSHSARDPTDYNAIDINLLQQHFKKAWAWLIRNSLSSTTFTTANTERGILGLYLYWHYDFSKKCNGHCA